MPYSAFRWRRGPRTGRDLLQQMVSYSCFRKGRFVAKGKGSRKARGSRTLQRHVFTPKYFSSVLLQEKKITGKRGCRKYKVPLGKKEKRLRLGGWGGGGNRQWEGPKMGLQIR